MPAIVFHLLDKVLQKESRFAYHRYHFRHGAVFQAPRAQAIAGIDTSDNAAGGRFIGAESNALVSEGVRGRDFPLAGRRLAMDPRFRKMFFIHYSVFD